MVARNTVLAVALFAAGCASQTAPNGDDDDATSQFDDDDSVSDDDDSTTVPDDDDSAGSDCEDQAGYQLESDCDGLDADCDGLPDCAGDCDDSDPTVRPGVPEQCDQLDHDCDGELVIPEDCPEQCGGPLEAFAHCVDGCPTLDEWVEDYPTTSQWHEYWSCGEWTFMNLGDLDGELLIWGPTCELVAGIAYSDVPELCFWTAWQIEFGSRPGCLAHDPLLLPACASGG